MPAMRRCTHPSGCPVLIPVGVKERRCPAHRRLSRRSGGAWDTIRRAVKDRDGHRCRGAGPHRGQLEVHHIDGDAENNDLRNLVTLCEDCHLKER